MLRLILGVLGLMASDLSWAYKPNCPPQPIPAESQQRLEAAARRLTDESLNLTTLHYCLYEKIEYAALDTVASKVGDGTERLATLLCSSGPRRRSDWSCSILSHRVIRVTPAAGEPEVLVALGEGASIEEVRARAVQAFSLLRESERVEGCPGYGEPWQTGAAFRTTLDSMLGPFELSSSAQGFLLHREGFYVRFKSDGTGDAPVRLECWYLEGLSH